VIPALAQLLDALPDEPVAFDGSDYPLPLCQAVLGRVPSPAEVRLLVEQTDPDDAGHLALHAAMAAECFEAAQPDARELFVSDGSLRGNVFMGSKWRAGWTFVLGTETEELRNALDERSFMVFSGGTRPTQPVYWLQMMVRYAMVWGRIPPGDDHEMGHFLEDDLPGALIVRAGATEMECLLALAMMKMGCPAIVPTDFPYEEGRQARTDDDADVLDAIATLPNMRVLEVGGERIALPEFCDPAHAREDFEAATTVGGDERSFFVLRAADVEDGTEVVGSPDGPIGIDIGVGDERLDLDVSQHLEKIALGLPGYLPGVRVTGADPLMIGLAQDTELDPERLAEAIRAGLKWNFPRLQRIHVRVICSADELDRAQPGVVAFRQRRADELGRRSEDTVDEFVACIECQSFSHSHVCIVTPDRVPMCGRDPGQVKCAALFGATWHPWKRRGLESQELREVIAKGRCLDPERGEYEGVNEAARRLSQGVIQRVFLHSLDGFPHSSCGCFHYLGFGIEGVGVGVMNRGFRGSAPNGETWDSLANKAGGKQADGVSGFSLGYLRSPKFLQGDGGLSSVVWMPYDVLEQVRDLLPPDRLPATENDAADLDELSEFVGRRP
jgi:acetyl-CoA decarbonylase/synthase complex subunit beta